MKLEQLNLADSGPSPTDDLAHARRVLARFLQLLSDMEDDRRYHFAISTIMEIKATIEATERVTDNQRRAIHNIQVGAQRYEDGVEDRQRGHVGGRRYEGFDGSNR